MSYISVCVVKKTHSQKPFPEVPDQTGRKGLNKVLLKYLINSTCKILGTPREGVAVNKFGTQIQKKVSKAKI